MKPEVQVINTRAELLAEGDIVRVTQHHADGAEVRTAWRAISGLETLDNGILRITFEGGKYHNCNSLDLIEVQIDSHQGEPA